MTKKDEKEEIEVEYKGFFINILIFIDIFKSINNLKIILRT